MPVLTTNVRINTSITEAVERRAREFLTLERQARVRAATDATIVSRSKFHYKREIAPPRSGRSSTGGQMTSFIDWRATRTGVALDVQRLTREAPHWIIQEIGTGESATIRQGGSPNPTGRPVKGANYVRTIPSQVGRRLKRGLVFASGGRYVPTGQGAGQQIFPASQVGAPRNAPRIVIRKEIEGQHFIRDGAKTGFRQYRGSALAAARQSFSRKGGRP